jgi:ornithine cyclodeaminase/alanine dehydrogenase-like protein (mu-crystallin family)
VDEGVLTAAVVHAELGREQDELIVCDLTGVGAQDAAIAEVAWETLAAQGS